jgi:hypothetical protein
MILCVPAYLNKGKLYFWASYSALCLTPIPLAQPIRIEFGSLCD